MKNASRIFTVILILPILACLYMEYNYMTNTNMSRELASIYEWKEISQIAGCGLLFGFSVFLTMRKKYTESSVLLGCFILFLIIQVIVSIHGQNRAHFGHP